MYKPRKQVKQLEQLLLLELIEQDFIVFKSIKQLKEEEYYYNCLKVINSVNERTDVRVTIKQGSNVLLLINFKTPKRINIDFINLFFTFVSQFNNYYHVKTNSKHNLLGIRIR